jgi:diguanylate cyclase (GGDEF)-like protein
MLLRKLLDAPRLDAELPLEVRQALVHALYAPFSSLVVGAVSGGVIGLIASYRAGDLWLTLCSLALCLVGAGRVFAARAYLAGSPPQSRDAILRWERIYQIGAGGFSGLLGALACLALARSSDLAVHLITATTATGYAAGITGRNAGRPFIALSQVALAVLPLATSLMLHGDVAHFTLGLVMLLFIYGMTDITLSVRDIVVQALVSTRENQALAKRYEDQAKRFDSALNNMSHGLCMFDRDQKLLVWNKRFLELSGLPDAAVVPGARARELLRRSIGVHGREGSAARQARLEVDEQLLRVSGSGQMLTTTADQRTLALSRRMMADGGSVIIFEDVTERAKAEARIARLARYDELTGLPNRMTLRERIAKALDSVQRREGRLAMHLIDLDYFKEVNDTLGHPVGDRLLQQVAERLQTMVSESVLVARFGGDEFVVLQFPLPERTDASDLARNIVETMKLSFEVEGHRVEIGASIGIALAPSDGIDADELLKRADMALYAAKADGRGAFRFFETAMDEAAQARRALDLDLRDALARGELEVLYQPLFDIANNRISGCEALLRWHHPVRGLIPPSEFIPVAEETGLIISLGEWVIQQACAEAVRWPSDTRVAVNLSPVQFKDPSLTSRVVAALARSGLPARRLELEITETTMLQDSEATLSAMHQLQTLGVRMSLDDFGTGYSSLSYLRKFPFQKIKVDGSFVRDLESDESAVAIVRAVAGMGANLGMGIVVEGVETAAQLELVRREGCHEVQGFLLGRPMSATAIRQRLSGRKASSRKLVA